MVDTQGQLVLPMAFLPAAERYNLMVQLDRWVISNFFKQWPNLQPKRTELFAAVWH